MKFGFCVEFVVYVFYKCLIKVSYWLIKICNFFVILVIGIGNGLNKYLFINLDICKLIFYIDNLFFGLCVVYI